MKPRRISSLFTCTRLATEAKLMGVLACLAASHCSLALNWDYGELACEGDRLACLEGYSCLPNGKQGQCIADHSRNTDQSCLLDRQCPSGELCPTGKCAPQCDVSLAYAPSTCVSGRYCAPSVSTAAGDGNSQLVAVCVPSDSCTPGMACTSVTGGICVNIATSVNACVTGCTQQYTAGTYSDNCINQDGLPTYCTPVGTPGNEQLVCLSTGPSPGTVSSTCISPVAQPCAAHLGCIKQTCRSYCDVQHNGACPSGQTCCSYSPSPTAAPIGYCIDSGQCG